MVKASILTSYAVIPTRCVPAIVS